MTFMQPRASYSPLGRQSFRPDPWRGFRGVSKNTTYIQNNFFGGSYGGNWNFNSCFTFGNYGNYNNCGCNCGGGGSKWMNWMLGIGIGTSLLGSILNMFGIGANNKTDEITTDTSSRRGVRREETHNDNDTDEVDGEEAVEDTEETEESEETDQTDETEHADEADETDKTKDKKDTINDILTVKKEEVKTSTNYKVNYGDTWANIITAKYKDENGNPISFADAKELWTKLKEECGVSKNADGMPSNIELPNEFKNYKLDINGKVTANTNFNNNNYKGFDGKGFKPSTATNYTATGTINGKSIGSITGKSDEVAQKLRDKGFSDKDIQAAMLNGEVKITKEAE